MHGLISISDKAKLFAEQIHANQFDKAGSPYICHLSFVAEMLTGEHDDVIAVAWLHDSVEDTETSLGDISALFGEVVAAAVNAITKRQGECYQSYLLRVRSNEIARKVKIADLTHNMDLSRLPKITEKDLSRQRKYQQAKQFLQT
ncbi:HD domain-containing protein [Pasteurella multocida]|uniref:HD domain-containing protein n=1 Tax=Pasteurella multocida TaxID=747 RepID=UPI0002839161|nr:HD domain-containing protein [Pasteurella multocida]ARB76498.1 bifunctional (p)ppGpp synthetase/guanosine-3',5'-bis(diphosphate) 3'-pyrophosphohydrolase [Pasteurella multocida]EJZ80273.1 Guanosine-3',5'-bis(Diphosphate) 3'-pyrophosphohydrolase [Pasteurella multocida subsp. gallicida P1059]MCL7756096.1 HD domain-containing protein [Pasteurella multocida]MCL7779826.1 HD domain-containing protein [Pasteurella multocida]MCL7790081.1 HD domain-containing protein [Pasteurella multocida]